MAKKFTNKEILNAIRNDQTEEYKSLVPVVNSSEDYATIMATFADYPTAKNAFVNTLTNKIGKAMFFDKVFSNPYKMLHRGMLPFGKSIEQLFVEMAEQKGFNEHFSGADSMEGDLIRPLPPSVKLDYITENYQYKFKTSISDEQLRGAFQSENGLHQLITHTVDSLLSSVQYSEYVDMEKLINQRLMGDIVNGGFTAQCDGSAKEIVKQIRILAGKMSFPTEEYNLAEVRTWSKKEDLVFFTTPEIQAELDVEVLAHAFNVSHTDVNVRVIIMKDLPAVGGKEVLGLLADRDLIQCYDTINTTSTFYNGERLTTNYFAHKHGLMAGCKFAQAVAIVKQ